MAPSTDDSIDSQALLRGALAGAVAYLLGYVLTYAWKARAVDDALRGINAIAELAGGQAIPTWKAVGWLFYNAHFVATRVPALGGGDRLVDFIARSDDGSLVLLYALPPLLLVLGGAAVARYAEPDRLASAATAGAGVFVGYLPLAILGALAVGHTVGGDVQIAPDLITAVALAGVVYPIFLGAVGGAVGWTLSGR